MKRIADIGLASVALVLLAPLLLFLAILVRWKLGFPILFRQVRPGLHGKPFTLLKFRTMTNKRDSAGQLLPDAKRLTRFGRFLRATSLDEFPELFNVIKGEMSLVGPRPLATAYLPLYSAEQARRHEVRPGITGWAQINGRNAISWAERFKLDVWYVENQSLRLDLKIMLKTLVHVVKRVDVKADGQDEVESFNGSN